MYPPLSAALAHSTPGVDMAFFALHLAGFSSLISSINFIITIIFNRPGNMSLFSMPLYCWSILVTNFLLAFSLPVLAGAVTMMLSDRNFNTTFFDPTGGGDCVLYQHLF